MAEHKLLTTDDLARMGFCIAISQDQEILYDTSGKVMLYNNKGEFVPMSQDMLNMADVQKTLRQHVMSTVNNASTELVADGEEDVDRVDTQDEGMAECNQKGRKLQYRFSATADLLLLTECIAQRPWGRKDESKKWDGIAETLKVYDISVAGIRCKRRVQLLVDQFKKADSLSLKKSGTEEEYDKKMALLQEITDIIHEIENTTNPVSKESISKRKQTDLEQGKLVRNAALESRVKNKVPANAESGEEAPKSTVPRIGSAKNPKMSPTKKNPLTSYLMKKTELELDFKSRQLQFEKEKLQFEKERLQLEREKFEAERLERQARLDLESKERKTMIELLSKKM